MSTSKRIRSGSLKAGYLHLYYYDYNQSRTYTLDLERGRVTGSSQVRRMRNRPLKEPHVGGGLFESKCNYDYDFEMFETEYLYYSDQVPSLRTFLEMWEFCDGLKRTKISLAMGRDEEEVEVRDLRPYIEKWEKQKVMDIRGGIPYSSEVAGAA